MSKLRTVKQCLENIKKLDPDTAVTLYYIRHLCKENKVKHFLAGNKILIDFDSLIEVLSK